MSLATARGGQRGRSPDRRPPRAVVVGLFLCVGGAALYVFGSSFLNVYRLNREAARLEALKRTLQQQNAFLREEIRLLGTPQYIERLAREQLGLVRPGEVSILIVHPPAQPEPAPARLQNDRSSSLHRFWRTITRWRR